MGINLLRNASFGAWRLMAKLYCTFSRANCLMRGTMPQVETDKCRAPMASPKS